MSGSSTIDLAGTIQVATARRASPWSLLQTLSGLEAKELEVTVPHAGTRVVDLGFSAGVTEACLLLIYSPRKLKVRYTSSASDAAWDNMEVGIKGYHLLTMPAGGGIEALEFVNADDTEDVGVSILIGSKAVATDDDSSFFTDR